MYIGNIFNQKTEKIFHSKNFLTPTFSNFEAITEYIKLEFVRVEYPLHFAWSFYEKTLCYKNILKIQTCFLQFCLRNENPWVEYSGSIKKYKVTKVE